MEGLVLALSVAKPIAEGSFHSMVCTYAVVRRMGTRGGWGQRKGKYEPVTPRRNTLTSALVIEVFGGGGCPLTPCFHGGQHHR